MIVRIFCVLTAIPCVAICQERNIPNPEPKKQKAPLEVVGEAIDAIDKIKSVEYISECNASYPYTAILNEPHISRREVVINKHDSIHGAQFKLYELDDTFKLKYGYDQDHVAYIDHEKNQAFVADIRKTPGAANSLIGVFHVSILSILENARSRNSDITLVESSDTFKLEVRFKDLLLECNSRAVRARDTIGFVSTYEIYLDKYSYLPVKMVRKMPHQISIETILYQNIHYEAAIPISLLQSLPKNYLLSQPLPIRYDSAVKRKLIGTPLKQWCLKEVNGDSVQFGKGKRSLIVFTSLGWRPCVAAVPFLKRLRISHHSDSLDLVSIDPFINNIDALKKYKHQNDLNYPLLVADDVIRNHFNIQSVPVFVTVSGQGIIEHVIFGFKGASTEAEILRSLELR